MRESITKFVHVKRLRFVVKFWKGFFILLGKVIGKNAKVPGWLNNFVGWTIKKAV